MCEAPCGLLLVALLAYGLVPIQGELTLTPLIVDEETGLAEFVLTVTPAPGAEWNISIDTAEDSAIAGVDFVSTSVSHTNLAIGVKEVSISVQILSDPEPEFDETFLIRVLDISLPGEQLKNFVVTIADDDRAPAFLDFPDIVAVREGSQNASLTLSRIGDSLFAFTITVNTEAVTALQGNDYIGVQNRQIDFPAGQTSLTIPDLVHIIDDSETEEIEILEIQITGNKIAEEIFIGVFIFDDETPVNSHCRRQGQFCQNGGACDVNIGLCSCNDPFDGPNCAINLDEIGGPECIDLPCQVGTCVVSAGVPSCICDPGFTRTLCDKKAYYHQCNPNNISVCITPFSVDTFVGTIYVTNHRNTVGCNLTLAPNPADPSDGIADWCQGYAGIFEYNGTCGDLGPITEGGMSIFQLQLSVRYSPGIDLVTDEAVTFNCTYSSDAIALSSQSLNISDNGGTKNGGDALFIPASQTVVRPDGTTIQGTVTSGESVKACVTVNGSDAFNGIAVHKITVNNTRGEPHYRERILYDEGCESDDGLLSESPEWNPIASRHTMCFEVEVFIFSDDNGLSDPALGIVTQVRVSATEGAAAKPTCATGRRRRDASVTGTSEDETLTSVVHLAKPVALASTSSEETTCAREWLMPAMIGLGIVSITMAVVIIILVYTAIRQFKSKQIQQNALT
ncbi:uncharacterized protein LOC124135992 [Haliotis rufescens]|uniref:uncharacterized protein LOC124135992 n=1 Tax=Haliotis rufescens TaxID=6454 RepID=UPI00201F226E|nr:uncharacterized protein LOC124135992 [Haliotis rufescens]